jgi:L-ribulose-5-phosphate 3-epimerase
MKKGIVVRAFSDNPDFLGSGTFLGGLDDFKKVFDRARASGYEGVQIYTEISDGFLSLKTDDTVLRQIARAAGDAGIEIPSLEIAPLQYSLTSDDAAERKRGIQVIQRSLSMAAELGARGVLVIPGYVGLPWEKSGRSVDYEQAYDRTVEGLRSVAAHARKVDVNIYVENIWNMFLLSPLEMRRLIDDVGDPHIGVLLDVGNVVLFGFPEQWVRILGRRIREVHLKDFRRSVGTVEGFVPLLAGDVNWPAVMKALRQTGFGGYLIQEIFPYPHGGDASLEHTMTALNRLLEMH